MQILQRREGEVDMPHGNRSLKVHTIDLLWGDIASKTESQQLPGPFSSETRILSTEHKI